MDIDLGAHFKQYTTLSAYQRLELVVSDTMREVTHRRPEREDDMDFVEGEAEVDYVPTITAYVDGQMAGALWTQRGESYSEHELEVAKVEVYDHRRCGIATVMWAAIKRTHSVGHSGFQTADGELWAEHVDAVVSDNGDIDLPEPELEDDGPRPVLESSRARPASTPASSDTSISL